MRTNSPISDPEPFTVPDKESTPQIPPSDYEKIAKSDKYPEFRRSIQDRIEFYQSYLPNGEPVGAKKPSESDWQLANVVISELKNVLVRLDANA